MTMAFATGITACSFGQVNLGVQAATQTAVNSTLNTVAATNAANTATQAVSATINTTVSKSTGVIASASSVVNTAGQQVISTGKNITGSVNTGTNLAASAQAGNPNAAAKSSVNADAGINAGSSQLADKTGQTTAGTLSTAKEVKSQAVSGIRSGANAAKETAGSIKPSASTGITTETKTSARTR